MVKKIKFSLILLLLVFITLGAVSAAEDVNTTADNNLISDSAVSYEPISYNYFSDSDIMTASVSHSVSSSNYGTYFDNEGNLKSSSVNSGDTMNLDGSFSGKKFILNKQLNVVGTSTNSMRDCTVVLLSEASGSTVSHLNIVNNGVDKQGVFIVGATNCNVHDNKITCSGVSSFPIALNPGSHHNIISNNIISSSGDTGIHNKSLCSIVFGGANYNTISNNQISVADANAIYGSAYDSGAFIGARSYNNVVFNNTIKVTVIPTSWNYAIQLMGDNNTADSNTIIGAFRGISSDGSTIVKNNKIINSTGVDHNNKSIVIGGEYGIVVGQNSIISNNLIQNALLSGSGICAADRSKVTNNTVDVKGKGYGIDANGNYVLVDKNNITTNTGAAVYQMGQYDFLTVTNNNIVSVSGVGVLLKKQSSTKFPANIVITDNDIRTSNILAIDAAEASKDSFTIERNNCHGSMVATPVGTVDPSKPVYVFNGTVYTVTEDNYYTFFDEKGNLNSSIDMGDTLKFVGTFKDKLMLITSGVKIIGNDAKFINSMFKVTTSHAWIENVTIINKNSTSENRWGVYIVDTNQVKLLNNNISVADKNAAYAVYIYRSGNVEIINNTLSSGGNYLTYTILGYGAENCEISGNIINTLGTGELHAYESSKCIDGVNDVKEIFRTYGILMIYSSDNKVLNNNVTVKSLINQSKATIGGNLSTNSLVGIDFYFDSNDNVISGNNILVEGKDNYLYGTGVIGAPTGSGGSKYSNNNQFIGNDIKIIGDYFATGIIAGYHSKDTIIKNNNVDVKANNVAYGLTLELSQASTILNNTFDLAAEVIYGIEGFASNNNKISQNTITGNGKDVYGIAAAGSKYNTISENKITANGNGEKLSFTNYDSIKEGNAGIFLTGSSTHNTIIDNEITSKTGFAVNLNTTAKNNIISNNFLSAKEGSGNDGVNNTNGNTVENNYKYIFSDIVFSNITVAYLDETTIKITAKLPFAGGIPGKANFYINGIKIGESTLSNNGVATLKYQLNASFVPGNYKITVTLSKSNYKSVNATADLIVTKGKLNISVDEIIGKAGNKVYFTASVKNVLGEGVKGIAVEFYRNGIYAGKAVSDENGIAKFIYQIPASFTGSYSISANASGNDYYFANSATSKLTIGDMVYTVISAKDVVMYYKNGTRLEGTLKDLNGNVISGADVKITINGVTYTRTTDKDGKFAMNINLVAGEYPVYIKFDSNDKQWGSDAKVNVLIKSTIASRDVTKMFRNGTQFYAVFYDGHGNLLKNTDVKFNINGVWYIRKTNDLGTARLNIQLGPGKYIITSVGPNGEQKGNVITVLSLLTENQDLVKYFKNGSSYTVKVIKQDGTVAGAGEKVTFNINGVLYERMTNANGVASLAINLLPGNYIITAMYKDCMVSNDITVKQIMFTSDLDMKYNDGSKFTATLIDGQGKLYANQIIKFNVNGVFYNRVTDNNGIASLNIRLLPGKYIITSIWESLQIGNTITINP